MKKMKIGQILRTLKKKEGRGCEIKEERKRKEEIEKSDMAVNYTYLS